MDEPMRREDLAPGLPVAYIGEDLEVVGVGGEPGGVMLSGHPGRVRQLHDGFHVLVDWVGYEDTEVSQVVGWGCDDQGPLMPGLARLSEHEYALRTHALAHSDTG